MIRSSRAPQPCGAFLFLLAVAAPCSAVNFVFDIEYLGDDLTNLAPGSDEPAGAMLEVGDTFQWTIASADDRFWLVETGGDFFPLMAFSADPGAQRTGDFSLQLLNDGVEVFSLAQNGVLTQEVHVGTNTVTLPTGLAFDEMFLDYELTDASLIPSGDPGSTTLGGRLPIFGAPESNPFSPGIAFVPEPSTVTLVGLAFAVTLRRIRV